MSETNNRYFVSVNDTVTVCENNYVNLKLSSGDFFEKLEPKMLFPISGEYKYITLLDPNGKEIAIIRNLSDLNKDSAQVVTESINNYYFVPVIEYIFSVTMKSGTQTWVVRTNRGIKQFEVRERNQNIRVYKDGTVRIRDSVDNRYIIKNFNKLDSHSIRQIMSDI